MDFHAKSTARCAGMLQINSGRVWLGLSAAVEDDGPGTWHAGEKAEKAEQSRSER